MNKCTLSIAALTVSILATSAHAASISGQGTWETTLQGRDLDGDFSNGFEAYYDTALDITWLADANYAAYTSGYGIMDWFTSNDWAASLNPYGSGITGWRLPTVAPINGTNFNTEVSKNATTDQGYADADGWVDGSGTPVSEMGHMYYVTLGNLGRCTPNDPSPGWGCIVQTGFETLANTGPFSNVHIDYPYWSVTEIAPYWPSSTLYFYFGDGHQADYPKIAHLYAWAVHDGDVGIALPTSEVPVPAAVWLFGSGLLGLLAMARKRRS